MRWQRILKADCSILTKHGCKWIRFVQQALVAVYLVVLGSTHFITRIDYCMRLDIQLLAATPRLPFLGRPPTVAREFQVAKARGQFSPCNVVLWPHFWPKTGQQAAAPPGLLDSAPSGPGPSNPASQTAAGSEDLNGAACGDHKSGGAAVPPSNPLARPAAPEAAGCRGAGAAAAQARAPHKARQNSASRLHATTAVLPDHPEPGLARDGGGPSAAHPPRRWRDKKTGPGPQTAGQQDYSQDFPRQNTNRRQKGTAERQQGRGGVAGATAGPAAQLPAAKAAGTAGGQHYSRFQGADCSNSRGTSSGTDRTDPSRGGGDASCFTAVATQTKAVRPPSWQRRKAAALRFHNQPPPLQTPPESNKEDGRYTTEGRAPAAEGCQGEGISLEPRSPSAYYTGSPVDWLAQGPEEGPGSQVKATGNGWQKQPRPLGCQFLPVARPYLSHVRLCQ